MVKKERKYQGPITAKELMDRLMQDPAYLRHLGEVERHKNEAHAKYMEAAKGVLEELRAAGFNVQSVGELRQQFLISKVPYTSAIPILMKWLRTITYHALKEDIIRTLSVPWANPIASRLMVDQFKNPEVDGNENVRHLVRWTIGNALEVVADDSVFDDLVKIANNKVYGTARQMVVLALGNMKNPHALEVLIELLDDEDVAGHAIEALGKLKAREAKPHIVPFLQHPKTWVRKEAEKAIKRIDKKYPSRT